MLTLGEAGGGHSENVTEFVCEVLRCTPDIVHKILLFSSVRSFASGTIIAYKDDKVTQTYLLILGCVRAVLNSPSGQVILLHEYRRGDMFGALDGADNATHDADLAVVEAAQTLVIRAKHLASLAEQHGCIGLALSRLLLDRLRKATEQLFDRSGLSSMGRVYAELLRQARLRPDFTISPAPPVTELALLVATTRETASRAVNGLLRRGILRRDADGLVVVAPRRLEEMIL